MCSIYCWENWKREFNPNQTYEKILVSNSSLLPFLGDGVITVRSQNFPCYFCFYCIDLDSQNDFALQTWNSSF